MDDIFDTNSNFPFEKVSLITPTNIAGGVHFSKILINKKQLYIQSPKCKTKMGIVKSGKKIHADLVFSNDDEEFIQWIEMLELTVRKHIHINREKWFDMDLNEDDIESYFTPTVKIFKSGKQYIMRVNVSQRIGSSPLKIYDENEMDVETESINENTPMITILEVQGVRCSAKSFQIDIELKQIMVLKPVNLFERCIIKSREKDLVKNGSKNLIVKTEVEIEESDIKESDIKEFKENSDIKKIKENSDIKESDIKKSDIKEFDIKEFKEESDIKEEFKELKESDDFFNSDDILEINLDIDEIDNTEAIHLKEKTEVYYQMYREAIQKAKLAKSLALSSYLEARRIKNLYMLDDIDDSDESDLEDLEN